MIKISINNNMVKSIGNYATQEINDKWKSISARANNNKKIKIANTGLVSSGKSSFFNVLVDSEGKNSRFAVGAARVTMMQDVENLNDMIELADTPGIDVNDEDNIVALDAVLESDIIIMIHNIKLGMLNDSEYKWLKSISDRMDNFEERKARLMFICNWIDERDSSPDYKVTVDETKRMVKEACGCDIDFYEISVKRYLTGIEKNRDILKQKSNIPSVKDAIIKKADEYSKISEKLLAKEIYKLCAETHKFLINKRGNLIYEKNSIIERIRKKYDGLKREWESAFAVFKNQYNIVKNKKREYENI